MPAKQEMPVILFWLALGLLALFQLLFNTHYQSDMSAFMPEQSQTVGGVGQSLKEGPAARLWLMAIKGAGDEDAADQLAQASKQFAQQLRNTHDFSWVHNGERQLDEATRELVQRHRYLLDERVDANYFSAESLNGFLQQRLDELRSPISSFTKQWLAYDPTAAMLAFMQRQTSSASLQLHDGVWLSEDYSHALIMAESISPGFELDQQQAIKTRLLKAFANSTDNAELDLVLSGAPEIALQTRHAIKSDAQHLSLIASLFMLLFMAWVYRSARKVLLTALPLGGGILVAAAVVSLWFGDVHAITLAFGITVLGVAVDYPIHLLSHGRKSEPLVLTMQRIWPTLRLGVASTLMGYIAMALTDFSGLAQLGVFSMAGLLTAALITRTLLPVLAEEGGYPAAGMTGIVARLNRPAAMPLSLVVVISVVAAVVFVWQQERIWSDDIARLSPIPAELRNQDSALREQLSGPANRYLISVESRSLESLLQTQEQLAPVLDQAVAAGEIKGYTMAAQLLPSQQLQRQRQFMLPDEASLRRQLAAALEGLPFRAQSFEPFINDVEQARAMELLNVDDLQQSQFGLQFDSLLSFSPDSVAAVVRLNGVEQAEALAQRLEESAPHGVRFVDLKQSSSDTVGQFRAEALERIVWASLLIVAALWLGLRHFGRVVGVVLPVAGAVVVAAAVPLLLGAELNIFNLVSLLLVAGIGLDYSLFFSRAQDTSGQGEAAATLHSLLVCCISTVTVFAILSTSVIPVLYSIGITVCSGALAAFILAWLFSRPTLEVSR